MSNLFLTNFSHPTCGDVNKLKKKNRNVLLSNKMDVELLSINKSISAT